MSYTFTTNLASKKMNTNQIEAFVTQAIHILNVQANYSTFNGEFKISIPKKVPANIYFAKLSEFLNCNVFYKEI